MPAPTKGSRLGGSPAHQRLMLANLATQLFENDRITTTEAKAKRLRPHAERLITIAKKGDLAAMRRVARKITDKGVANKLVTEIAPAMAGRDGGYTRIIKVGFRKGDSAPMAVIELVKESVAAKKPSNKAKPKSKKSDAVAQVFEVEDEKPTTAGEEKQDNTDALSAEAEKTEQGTDSDPGEAKAE